ncbi:MAG TPA: tetratricopeptide repeat protein [Candidatus Omnitrophota bacterium]|nr:tetratricopeptide repeat protein [Candidatus Omnitrophota bacterium]HPS37445.1 tetratricopeptide repeat protein [Candidatus Omnitrophota bacterium]
MAPVLAVLLGALIFGNFSTVLFAGTPAQDIAAKVRYYNEQGMVFRRNGNQEEAVRSFTKAIELDPRNAESYSHRAMSYGGGQVGAYDRALADINRAIELAPRVGEYYFTRALIYERKESYTILWEDVRKAGSLGFEAPPEILADLKKSSAQYYNNRGFALAREGKTEAAIADYAEAIAMTPEAVLPYANRGNAYLDMRRYDDAIADYQRALKLEPANEKIQHDLGLAYLGKGDLDRALVCFDKAIKGNPPVAQLGQFFNDRAVAYFGKKNYNKSWKDLHQAVKLGYKVHPGFLKALKQDSKRES